VRRLPVFAIIREAYTFTFAHLGAIIAIIWLPMALVTVLGFFAEQRIFAAVAAAYAAHGAATGPAMLLFPAYVILAMLLYASMMVAVAGLALGTRQPSRMPFHFGLAEWRLFRAWFGLVLFLLVPLLLFMLAASTLMPADPGSMTTAQASRLSLLVLLLATAMIFVGLRFTFLLPGLAAGEGGGERGLLTRAWTLSNGNFWRVFAVAAACVLPVYFCGGVLEAMVETLVAPDQAASHDLADMIARSRETLPLTKGFQFLLAPFIIGLMASASVYAGRELNRTDTSA
jgi:hypothetical protein